MLTRSSPRTACRALTIPSQVLLAVLLTSILVPRSIFSAAAAQQAEPLFVTIAELVRSPEQYSGKDVAFEGILVGTGVFSSPEGEPSGGPGRGRRVPLTLTDMSGARIFIITWVPSYDLPALGMVGRTGTVYAVRGTFYHVPMEPGTPLQFVVPKSKEGFKKK